MNPYQGTEHESVRREDFDDLTVQALGKLTESLERLERARGALYDLHQLIGGADAGLDQAAELFEKAGHPDAARRLREDLVGKNVIEGRWTFQLVEEFDDGYYAAWKRTERELREQYAGGRRHSYEAAMKLNRQRPESPEP
jgi:hypothetical protein